MKSFAVSSNGSVLLFRQPWLSNPTLLKAYSQESIHGTTDPVSIGPSEDPVDIRFDASSCFLSIPTTSDPSTPGHACWVQVRWLASDDQTAQTEKSLKSVNMHSLARSHDHVVESEAALSSKKLALSNQMAYTTSQIQV